jgi:KTSC domain
MYNSSSVSGIDGECLEGRRGKFMEYIELNSSNLHSVKYEAESEILTVIFQNGSKYSYFDVPEKVYLGLINAGSHGSFFHAEIKDSFSFKKI